MNHLLSAAAGLHELLYGENEIIESVFLGILDRAVSASYLIAAVLIVRYLLRNSPKNFRSVLWILAGIRLICPYSAESALSLVPVQKHMDTSVLHMRNVQIDTGIPVLNDSVSQYLQGHQVPVTSSANPAHVYIIYICARIWLAGAAAMILYFAYSWIKLKRKLRFSVPREIKINGDCVKIYDSSQTESPILFGLFRPKIYMPYSVRQEDISFVAVHESMHKKRKDYILKPAGYLVLACYWFHPLVWISYILMCRDIEFACDEAVIRTLGPEYRKEYSKALLSCSVRSKFFTACPTAFGEAGVKERIKSILNYKKPALWGIVTASVLCTAVAVCFMTQKKEETGAVTQNENIVYESDSYSENEDNRSQEKTPAGKSEEGNVSDSQSQEETLAGKSEDSQSQEETLTGKPEGGSISDSQSQEETPIQEIKGAASIGSYFPKYHEEQQFLMMEADLDQDGYAERVVMSNLGYNGGDGGYKIEVFRIKNGTEERVPLPEDYAEESGFPFYMEWSGKEAFLSTPGQERLYFAQPQILDIYQNHEEKQQIISYMDKTGLYSDYPADAVSGFTVVKDAKDNRPVLVLKQYLMGYLGHADCFGYAVSFLKLQKNNTWETEFAYLPE